jgi:uncharacterized membrane protein YfcA
LPNLDAFIVLAQTDVAFYTLLFVIGGLSAFINVMAGGGSVITLSSMILCGVDPQVANGTNRVAILAESLSAMAAFKRKLRSDLRESLKLSLWTLPGAVTGALFSVDISSETFQKILSLVIVLVVITILFPMKGQTSLTKPKQGVMLNLSLLLIGFYGGFIQVGIGFVIMVCFRQLTSLNLIAINVHKVLLVFVYSCPVILLFSLSGHINWLYAAFLGAGTVVGAWLSVHVSISKGEGVIKLITAFAMILMAAQLWLSAS